MSELMLDPEIRSWVLVPIFIFMFLVGAIRQHVDQLFQKKTKKQPISQLRYGQSMMLAKLFAKNGNFLPKDAFDKRKAYLTDSEHGPLAAEKAGEKPVNPMMDPSHMMDMLKGNFTNIVPNLAMMGFVSYFFSGFVLVRFPFPLFEAFRGMLQRDIDLPSLSVSFATSLSMYFLILFGLRDLFSLVLDSEEVASSAQDPAGAMMIMPPQMMMFPGQNDPQKAFVSERENLLLLKHNFELENVEQRLLGNSFPLSDDLDDKSTLDPSASSTSSSIGSIGGSRGSSLSARPHGLRQKKHKVPAKTGRP